MSGRYNLACYYPVGTKLWTDLLISSLFNVKGKVGERTHSSCTISYRLNFLLAVVTGGGSGIGTMIATTLVQNGAKVYIASRKESQLKEVW